MNYLVHGMIVASSLLAVAPGCRDSGTPKNTSAQSIVGKWIQEMVSQSSVTQTEFFEDGTLRVQKYTMLPESTVAQLKSRGVNVGSMESLGQSRRNLTYYAINAIGLRIGKVIAARPLTGTWSIEDGILVQTFTSEVFRKTETRLVDWTRSLYVAAYFAVMSSSLDGNNNERDGSIWCFESSDLVVGVKKKYGNELSYEGVPLFKKWRDNKTAT